MLSAQRGWDELGDIAVALIEVHWHLAAEAFVAAEAR